MINFSKLPDHIKENIFSRLRIRDLYEVSVVSEEWFWLTIKTYKGILRENDPLIKSLLDFCNREKQLPTPLMWYDLVKHGNFSDVEIDHIPHPLKTYGPLVLKSFLESRRPIRSLCISFSGCLHIETNLAAGGSNKTNLDSILKCFAHLVKLKLQNSSVDPSSLSFPKGITQVHLSGIEAYGLSWSGLFEHPESIQYLELDVRGLTFDQIELKNLKSLALHFKIFLPTDKMKIIIDLIRGHKHLKSVKLNGAIIAKEWFNVFGEAIENISLQRILIEEQLLNNGYFERQVMSFVCSDFRNVKRFTLATTSFEYSTNYICIPKLMEEKLWLNLSSFWFRQVQTVTRTDAGVALRELHIISTNVKAELFTNCVPASVKRFTLRLDGELKKLSINQLCGQPQNLEELQIVSLKKISILPNCFEGLTNLKLLEMTQVTREGIQNLLQQCASLQKLTLPEPERGCFTGLSPSCVSKTIREVNLYESDATLDEILYLFPNLEVLHLSSHLICPNSMPTAITKLKLFSIMFDGFFDIHDVTTRLALLMDSMDVPCKLFQLKKSHCKFILAQNDSFIEAVHATDEHIYCSGFPTRFLEARGFKILGDIKDFRKILKL